MSQTMSSPKDHQWGSQGQFYNRSMFLTGNSTNNDSFSDATVVTTTINSTSTVQNPFVSVNSNSSGAGNLSPEGRVSKPIRRRSRASRRTPTTLLNTDTTNFRAMVQQFTGGPTAPFGSSGSNITTPGFRFTLNPRQAHMVPSGFQQQYQQNQQYEQPNPAGYMFSLGGNGNNSNNSASGGGDHLFFQRLGNPRPTGVGMEVSDGLGMDSTVAAPPLRPPADGSLPPSSTNENRSNSFLY